MIYVILAHNNPEMMGILIGKLAGEDNYFVIHVDKNHDILPFKEVVSEVRNCHFTTIRFASYWGSFGLIEATLHAMDYVRKNLRKKQRIVLLSGSDYPIKNNIYIERYLSSHPDTIFIEHTAIPRRIWFAGGVNRFPLYDKIKEQINLYGGSQWFSIPYKALAIIFKFLKSNPDFITYYRHVNIPDESFFQTLLLNCDHSYIEKNLRNHNLHHIRWDKPYLHPRILTLKDLHQIHKSKSLFARKFTLPVSKSVLSALDNFIVEKPVIEKSKTAILFLTNKPYESIREKYEKLKHDMGEHVFLIVTEEKNKTTLDQTILYEHHFCKQMGYMPFNEDKIIPGSTYFAALYFKTIYSDYENYWLIEDDVWFNGDWKDFFCEFTDSDADFISTYFTLFHEADHWYWWDDIHTIDDIKKEYRVRTFYPICRFSSGALAYLDERLKKGDYGHGEVLVPTLLQLKGFKFQDIANSNPSSIIPCTKMAIGEANNGTFRYRPFISQEEIEGKYLFHPVKESVGL